MRILGLLIKIALEFCMAYQTRSSSKVLILFLFISVLMLGQHTLAQQVRKHHHKKPVIADTAPSFKLKTIIIDAGHGGKDPGAHGAYSKEKNVTLAIAKRLRCRRQQ